MFSTSLLLLAAAASSSRFRLCRANSESSPSRLSKYVALTVTEPLRPLLLLMLLSGVLFAEAGDERRLLLLFGVVDLRLLSPLPVGDGVRDWPSPRMDASKESTASLSSSAMFICTPSPAASEAALRTLIFAAVHPVVCMRLSSISVCCCVTAESAAKQSLTYAVVSV